MDSRNKVGKPTAGFQKVLIEIYKKNPLTSLWLGKLIIDLSIANSLPLPSEITSSEASVKLNINLTPEVAGITKIRTVSSSSTFLFEHMLKFCSFLVVAIPKELLSLAKEKFYNENIIFIDQPIIYNDSQIYKNLFDVGRQNGATHFLHLDDDERLDPRIDKVEFTTMCQQLEPGFSLAMKWEQLVGTKADKIIDFSQLKSLSNIRNSELHKDVLYCDDGMGRQSDLQFHSSWLPVGFPKNRTYSKFDLLHLEGVSIDSQINKFNRYIHWDYSMTKDIDVVYQRYLPLLMRLMLILNPQSHNKILKSHSYGPCASLANEIKGTFYTETLNEIISSFDIRDEKALEFLADIVICEEVLKGAI